MDASLEAIAGLPIRERLEALEKLAQYHRENKALFFKPYAKQTEFFALGKEKTERMLSAGNQFGKTIAGAYELACHLTGLYPRWWKGRRWRRPVRAWCAGESAAAVRDALQAKLCGDPVVEAEFGTGFIPRKCLDRSRITLSKGVAGAFDTVPVRHFKEGREDGWSVVQFKSYEQGRGKFQSATLDIVWLDEEPPEDIYIECLARTTATGGSVYLTYTPFKGATHVTERFLGESMANVQSRGLVVMSVDDIPHMTPEIIEKKKEEYPSWQWKARLYGLPMLGEGAVFPVPEEQISFDEPDILARIPLHWAKLWGIDFGIGHPFAATLMVWDKDSDVRYLIHEIKMADAIPVQHAAEMRRVAANVPVAWPHDGNSRDAGSGLELAKQYKKPHLADGLNMRADRAEFPDGSISTEAGVMKLLSLMKAGKFKVHRSCQRWFAEFRKYHRKDGKIVKVDDDLMSATRIAIMDERHARPVALGSKVPVRRRTMIEDGSEEFWNWYHGS